MLGEECESVIESLPNLRISFLYCDPDAFAKEICINEGTASKAAAILTHGALDPKAERYPIAENRVYAAVNKRIAQELLGLIDLANRFWEIRLEIGFVRAMGLNANRFSAQAFRCWRHMFEGHCRDETRRRGVIGPCKIQFGTRLRIDAYCRDHRIALVLVQRID